ncbi:MAG: o-succinylbenzoate synthase [Phycisphaerae bacterium]|nr:o-succinylbenzoate synthase [Phycisphaerae bacterium]
MKIDRLDIHHVRLPLIKPWRTAYGEDADIESVLVKAHSGDVSAWVETTPLAEPTYCNEWAGGVAHTIEQILAPRVVGREWDTPEQLNEMLGTFRGNSFAKAGIDNAWWALRATLEGVPLGRLLGGQRTEIASGHDFGVEDTIDILLAEIQDAIDRGYPRIKLKIKRGWDLEVVQAVRKHWQDFTFHVDCNSGYTLDDVDLFKQLDKLHLAMFEQPLGNEDLADHAELQRQVGTPVCLDESVRNLWSARQAIKLGSCRMINIKPGRVGGLTTAKAIHDLAAEHGIPCWVGGMLESAIGVGILVELATLGNFTYPNDVIASKRLYKRDITDPEVTECRVGWISASKGPYTDFVPNEERIASQTIRKAVVTA